MVLESRLALISKYLSPSPSTIKPPIVPVHLLGQRGRMPKQRSSMLFPRIELAWSQAHHASWPERINSTFADHADRMQTLSLEGSKYSRPFLRRGWEKEIRASSTANEVIRHLRKSNSNVSIANPMAVAQRSFCTTALILGCSLRACNLSHSVAQDDKSLPLPYMLSDGRLQSSSFVRIAHP